MIERATIVCHEPEILPRHLPRELLAVDVPNELEVNQVAVPKTIYFSGIASIPLAVAALKSSLFSMRLRRQTAIKVAPQSSGC